jgi:hypothetical protein
VTGPQIAFLRSGRARAWAAGQTANRAQASSAEAMMRRIKV